MAAFRPEPFRGRVGEEVLADLRARIWNTRWPGAAPGAPWEQGTDLAYLRGLLGYWADGLDWRAQERWLNCAVFTIDGQSGRWTRARPGSTGGLVDRCRRRSERVAALGGCPGRAAGLELDHPHPGDGA